MTNQRAHRLAERLEEGVRALATFAASLSEGEWQMRVPGDLRKIGVTVHHVASVFPLEIKLAQTLANRMPIDGVTGLVVNAMNATHAKTYDAVGKDETIELLRRNGADAAAAIRALTDAQLDAAATVSLYGNAPLTCQFMLEDHAVRHSYHHLARLQAAVNA
jgi:hypothetical protein